MSGRSLCKSWLHFQKFFFTTETYENSNGTSLFLQVDFSSYIGRHQIQVTSCMIENVSTSLSELCYISNGSQYLIHVQGQQFQVACCSAARQNNKAHVHVRTDHPSHSSAIIVLPQTQRELLPLLCSSVSSAETCFSFRPYLAVLAEQIH